MDMEKDNVKENETFLIAVQAMYQLKNVKVNFI